VVTKQDAEEDISAGGGGSKRRLEKTSQYGAS
jgi:hypothetical protein